MTKLPALPAPSVTGTQGIFAQKRKGKSYTAQTQAEDFLEAQRQIAVIDPTGAWWGLRSSADGKHPGYPITIFGGEHADAPLELRSGKIIAEALVEQHFSAVLDLTLFDPEEWAGIVGDFLDRLYTLNRTAILVFIDEVDQFAPQTTESKAQQQCRRIVNRLIRLGGIKGIGCTVITQRTAVLDKSILSQCETIVALQMNGARDLDAIRKELANHASKEIVNEVIGSLGSIPRGEAWCLSPATKTFERVTVRAKRTFDSGRTPLAGEVLNAPKKLAPVDIKRLGAAITATVEKAKANDPTLLKAKVAALEKELAKKLVTTSPAVTKTVEKAVIKADQIKRIESAIARGEKLVEKWDNVSANAWTSLQAIHSDATETFQAFQNDVLMLSAVIRPIMLPKSPVQSEPGAKAVGQVSSRAVVLSRPTRAPSVTATKPAPSGDGSLTGPQRELLTALAWWRSMGHDSPTKAQVAAKAGWKLKGSHLRNRLAELHGSGLIAYPRSGVVALTDAGEHAAPAPDLNVTLIDSVRSVLTGPQTEAFDALRAGGDLTRANLAARIGWEEKGSHLRNRLAELSAMQVVEYPDRGSVRLQNWVTA